MSRGRRKGKRQAQINKVYEDGREVKFPRCADCGEPGERTGHMDCQYPQDHH